MCLDFMTHCHVSLEKMTQWVLELWVLELLGVWCVKGNSWMPTTAENKKLNHQQLVKKEIMCMFSIHWIHPIPSHPIPSIPSLARMDLSNSLQPSQTHPPIHPNQLSPHNNTSIHSHPISIHPSIPPYLGDWMRPAAFWPPKIWV